MKKGHEYTGKMIVKRNVPQVRYDGHATENDMLINKIYRFSLNNWREYIYEVKGKKYDINGLIESVQALTEGVEDPNNIFSTPFYDASLEARCSYCKGDPLRYSYVYKNILELAQHKRNEHKRHCCPACPGDFKDKRDCIEHK